MRGLEQSLIQIYLLGRFEIAQENHSLKAAGWTRRKAAALLQRLALERRLVKDQAIEFLWPNANLSSGANNLYRTIYELRQTLENALGVDTADAIFSFTDGILALNESIWVDAHAFERLATNPIASVSDLQNAIELYQGDLLPDDPYSDWLSPHRERLRRLYRETCFALSDVYGEQKEYARALSLLSLLLEDDPADETAHCAMMRLFALSGRRHEALRQYQSCVDALATELGAPPAPETTALYSQILSGELAPRPAPVQLPGSSLSPMGKPRAEGGRSTRPTFVRRERELSVLLSYLEAAMAGNGGIVFITGEAGQGKTSLMAEFARRAQIAYPELVVAAGACQALMGVGDPYLPFRDLFAMLNGDWQRPWLGGDIAADHIRRLQAVAPHTARAIADYAPDLVDIMVPRVISASSSPFGAAQGDHRASTLDASPPAQRTGPGTRDLSQRQIFDQTTQLLRILAHHRPLLLILDDLQWADTASTNLLFHLGRQLANSAVLIIGAYRPSEISAPDVAHPLVSVVQELVRYRGEIQIDLDTLGAVEGRRFVDALLDSEPNRLDASFREALFRRTKGHPLFTVELLRALQEQGDLALDETGRWTAGPRLDWEVLPARVEAVIARRIDRLRPELRQLLAVASVEGESFTAEVVAQVQGLAIRPLLHQLSQELDQRYRLVRERGETRSDHLAGHSIARYQFRHNLFQHYLYHQLSPAERRHLHGEIAAALEQIGGADLDNLAVSLAYHTLAAGDSVRAVPYLCRAGDVARRRVALEEAIQFYQSALERWQADDPAAKAELLHKLGSSLLALGNASEAIGRFSEAEPLYARVGDHVGMGAMQRLIGRSYYEQGERARALDYYHKALSLLEPEPENPELARVISAISQMHMSRNEYDEAIAWGERALSLAQGPDAEDVVLHALTTVGVSLANKGEAERGLAMVAKSQQQAEALGLPHDTGRAYAGWGDALVTLERYEEARALYERMLAYSRKVHAGMFEGVALVQLAYLDWWSGRWRQAWARRQEIVDWMATFPGSSFAKVWAGNLLGLMYNDVGQPEKARAILAEYTAVARSAHEPQTTVPHLGQLARCAQSQAQVAALVQEILSLTDTVAYPPYEIMPALTLACGWLAQSSGGDDTALRRLEKVQAQMQNRQATASLYKVRAIAAGIRGEWDQAAADYEVAAASWEALQRPYDLLRTLAGLHQALAHIEDEAAARAVQRQAGSLIGQLAAELAEAELKQSFLASPLVVGNRGRSL